MREQHFSFCFFFLKLTILLDIKEYQSISVAILGINNLLENQRLLHDFQHPGEHNWRVKNIDLRAPRSGSEELLAWVLQL